MINAWVLVFLLISCQGMEIRASSFGSKLSQDQEIEQLLGASLENMSLIQLSELSKQLTAKAALIGESEQKEKILQKQKEVTEQKLFLQTPKGIKASCEYQYPFMNSDPKMVNYPKSIDPVACRKAYVKIANANLRAAWKKAAKFLNSCSHDSNQLRSMAKGILTSMLASSQILKENYTFDNKTTEQAAIDKFEEYIKKTNGGWLKRSSCRILTAQEEYALEVPDNY